MPTYEYECEKCNKTFEFKQSMNDKALCTCPESACCMETWGKGAVKRLISGGAGLIFKGTGFYITDYRSEGYKSAAKADKESATKAATPATTTSGSETKSPEPKPKPAPAKAE